MLSTIPSCIYVCIEAFLNSSLGGALAVMQQLGCSFGDADWPPLRAGGALNAGPARRALAFLWHHSTFGTIVRNALQALCALQVYLLDQGGMGT